MFRLLGTLIPPSPMRDRISFVHGVLTLQRTGATSLITPLTSDDNGKCGPIFCIPPPLDPLAAEQYSLPGLPGSEFCVERLPMYRNLRKITSFVTALLLFALASP